MPNFKDLSASKDYELILSQSSLASAPKDYLYVFNAYLSLSRGKEAMEYFLKHRDEIWDYSPLLCMKADFETRFALRQFDEAYEDETYFSNRPYVSQEVEEQLHVLKEKIRNEELASRGKLPIEEEKFHDVLRNSRDPSTLLAYLSQLKKSDLMPYVADLHNLLQVEDVHDDVKSFVLMLLSAHHDDVTVSFQKGGKKFTLIPAEIRNPFSLPNYLRLRRAIMGKFNPSIGELAGEILDQWVLAEYPAPWNPPLEEDKELLAIEYLSKRYLSIFEKEEDVLASKEANRIGEILAKQTPISL